VTRSDDAPTSALLDRLQAGESPAQVREALGLGPAEYVGALGQAAFGSDDPADWPGLTQGVPRRPWLAGALEEGGWADAFPRSSRPARLAVAAGLLQVHDFWDASHQAAQRADDLGERAVSAYWHGIAHRREPDPGNAAYWFRRVGPHPLFARLAHDSRPILESAADRTPIARLIANSSWNPFAFIDMCASARHGSEVAGLALRLQRLEMLALLDATLHALGT
jgi:hypothetical protein